VQYFCNNSEEKKGVLVENSKRFDEFLKKENAISLFFWQKNISL